MPYNILAINPGSTSTKVAIFEEEREIWSKSLEHPTQVLHAYPKVFDQLIMRYELIIDAITHDNHPLRDLSAVVGRGGLLPGVKAGAYLVTPELIQQLEYNPVNEHASNLGAPLAFRVASQMGIPAYIYDPVTVDEMIDVVRVTGRRDINRLGKGHNLNMRAAAIRCAKDKGWDYGSRNIIVAHLGGGITLSLHSQGRIIDMISDDEGPFSPERAGALPWEQLIRVYMDGKRSPKELMKLLRQSSGLMDHLGTVDSREVEQRIEEGDRHARLVYQAMALGVAKCIAQLAVVVEGQVDAIVLTGGIARSQMLTGEITRRVAFLAPVNLLPGENEMEALALGTLRVLRGEEKHHCYGE